MKKNRKLVLFIFILCILISIPIIYFISKSNNIQNTSVSIPDIQKSIESKEVKTINETNLSILGTTNSNEIICLNYGDESGNNSSLKFFNSDFSNCSYEIPPQDSKKQIYSACVTEDSIFWIEASNTVYRDDWTMYRCTLNNKFIVEIDKGTVAFKDLSLTTPTIYRSNHKL